MAIASRNLDKQEDAEKYVKEAIRHLDGMTERERYRTRGMYYFLTSDYQACVKEYGDLIARYCGRRRGTQQPRAVPDVPAGHAQGRRRDAPGREGAAEPCALPGEPRAVLRPTAVTSRPPRTEAQAMQQPGLFGCLRWRSRRLGQGQLPQAAATYREPGQDRRPGRVLHGVRPRRPGDLRRPVHRTPRESSRRAQPRTWPSKDTDRAANKFAALAYTQLLRRQNAAAIAAAEQGAGEQPGREDPVPGRPGVRRGGRDRQGRRALGRPRRRAAGGAPGLRPDHRRPDGAEERKPAPGHQGPDGGQRPARHVDRPLRSGAGLPGSRRVPAGRFRVRPLHQAPRRGPVPVPGRGADVRLLPARLLLPGPGAAKD